MLAELPYIEHITEYDKEHVYVPFDDTYIILDALEKDRVMGVHPGQVICEVGTGSGTVATWVAMHYPESAVIGSDISSYATSLAARTAAANNVHVSLVLADLCRNYRDHSIDCLVFNPPYVPSPSTDVWTPQRAEKIMEAHAKGGFRTMLDFALDGGKDGREVIDRFIADLRRVMRPNGKLYLASIEDNRIADILELLRDQGMLPSVFLRRVVEDEVLIVIKAEME